MKQILTSLALTVGFMTASCQSNTYKIEVTGDALGQQDTLYISTDLRTGAPSDTIVGKEGKYVLEATTDTTQLAILFAGRPGGPNKPFFIEPGTIKINLSAKPAQCKASGTKTNELYQQFTDSTMAIAARYNEIASSIREGKLTETEQKAKEAEMEALDKQYTAVVNAFAKDNIKNELGYLLLTMYNNDIDDQDKTQLIAQLPDKMRSRAAIKQLEATIAQRSKTAEGSTLADYTMDDIDGNPTSILALVKQNKLTVIDFWASWCGPCRAEMPTVVKMYADNKAKGLGIIGISLDNDKAKWAAAVKQLGITWPQLSDLKGWGNGFAKVFAVNGIPYTVVIDQQGKILKKGLRGEELARYVEQKLK